MDELIAAAEAEAAMEGSLNTSNSNSKPTATNEEDEYGEDDWAALDDFNMEAAVAEAGKGKEKEVVSASTAKKVVVQQQQEEEEDEDEDGWDALNDM